MANMSIRYFDDLQFIDGDIAPRCDARIDQCFESIYSLQYVVDGRMRYCVDGGAPHVLGAGDFFWHHPEHHYKYAPCGGATWHHAWVSFRGARARRILETGFMQVSPAGWTSLHDPVWARECFSQLVNIVHHDLPRRQGRACLLVDELLLLARDESGEERPVEPRHEIILKHAGEIQNQPGRDWNFSALARLVHVSASHYRRLFRQLLHASPHDYLIECRVRYAAARLRQTSEPVKLVAAEVGYDDPAQFSRAFKRRTGFSPRHYRELMPQTSLYNAETPD